MRRNPGWFFVALLTVACGATPAPHAAPPKNTTALVGGHVQPDPESAVIADGVVVIADGRIAAVGRRADTAVPPGATVIDCTGGTVTAGFWNSHVHLMSDALQGAERAPAAQLSEGLRVMLTSYGVVHAVDTGSRLANTVAKRFARRYQENKHWQEECGFGL